MAFVRGAWKIIVAIKDALVLLFLLAFFGLIFAVLASRPNPAAFSAGALNLKLDGMVVEQPADPDPFAALTGGEQLKEYSRRDIVQALDAARTDDRVKAVVLDLDGFLGGGQVALSDIGAALDRVRAAKKPVYAYATIYANDGYQLAAHADEIWADPFGGAIVAGPGGSNLYFKQALDNLGVTAHIYRVGTYKSAVEPFMRDDQSPESKAALSAVYGEMWEDWLAEIRKARPKAKLDQVIADPAAAIEGANGDPGKLALSTGMVDKLGDRNAFAARVAKVAGEAADPRPGKFAAIPLKNFVAAHPLPKGGEAIGVITVAGEIIDGESGPGQAGGDTIAKLIEDGLKDNDLKALVVRVDSPGGSVLASEKIRLAIETAKKQGKPIVVSMGNLAASGGYWISTPADVIFAEPDTITGSIGIFGVIPSFEKTLAKIGVTADGVKTTPLAGEPDILGGVSPAFDRFAQSTIEQGYREFLQRVATSRKKSVEQVDAIGQGRIWAGGTARQIGLVDRFGGLDAAIVEAAKRAKLDSYHRVYLDQQPDGFTAFMAGLFGPGEEEQESASLDVFARAQIEQRMAFDRALGTARMLATTTGAQARCLECAASSPAAPRPIKATSGSFWEVLLMKALGS